MYRKIIYAFIISCFCFILCCSSNKYSDATETYTEANKIHEELITSLEKANSVKEIVDTLNRFTSKAHVLQPRMIELIRKYPEIKDQELIPNDLKPLMERLKKTGEAASISISKVYFKYGKNPEVQNALTQLEEALRTAN